MVHCSFTALLLANNDQTDVPQGSEKLQQITFLECGGHKILLILLLLLLLPPPKIHFVEPKNGLWTYVPHSLWNIRKSLMRILRYEKSPLVKSSWMKKLQSWSNCTSLKKKAISFKVGKVRIHVVRQSPMGIPRTIISQAYCVALVVEIIRMRLQIKILLRASKKPKKKDPISQERWKRTLLLTP